MYRNSLRTWSISKNNTPSYYKRNWGLKVCGRLLFLYWKVTNNPCFTLELRARSGKKGEQTICANTTVSTRFVWLLVRWTGGIYGLLAFREPLRYCPNWYEKAYSDAFPLIAIRQYKMRGSLPVDEEIVLLYRRSAPAQIRVLCYPKNQILFTTYNNLGCLTNWENVQERKETCFPGRLILPLYSLL